MPLVLLKEPEELLKCLVGNLNVFTVERLKLVFLKDAAVEVGDLSEQLFHLSGAFLFGFGKPFKEEWTEEFFVVSVGALFLALC